MKKFLAIVLILLLPFIAAGVATQDDAMGQTSLSFFSPLVDRLIYLGDLYALNSHIASSVSLALAFLVFLVLSIQSSSNTKLFTLAFVLAIAAQFCILQTWILPGVLGYIVSAALVLIPNLEADSGKDPNTPPESWGKSDIFFLFVATGLAVFFRTYAINVLPDYFEGELSPYSAAATSIPGWFLANLGLWGPWAPLGILYYVPIYVTTSLFGTTLSALRLSSMLVGALTIPILYVFLKELSGRLAAQLGSILLALNQLHIGWGRTDIHPHGATLWPAVLVALFTLRVLRGQGRYSLAFLVLAMALSWHQYPSGQSAAALPIIAVAVLFVLRKVPKSVGPGQVAGISLGGLLWYLGLPFSYYLADGKWRFFNPFTLTTQRTSWGNTSLTATFWEKLFYVFNDTWTHLCDVMVGVFYRVPYLFNQDFVPETPGLSVRTVPWVIAALFIPCFFLLVRKIRSVEAVVLLSWLLVALLPGVLSERAYPKRLSTFYPVLDCIVTVGIAHLYTVLPALKRKFLVIALACSLISLTCYSASAWFSGRSWKFGTPPEVAAAKEIDRLLEPNTIVLGDVWKNYLEGKLTYLLVDALSDPANRPNAWLTRWPLDSSGRLLKPLDVPFVLQTPNWSYNWSRLSVQLPESINNRSWKHVIFVLQKRAEEPIEFEAKIAMIMADCLNPQSRTFFSEGRQMGDLTIIKCDI